MTIQTNFNTPVSHLQGTTNGMADYYQRGLELAEAGRHQEALGYIQEHLRKSPNDVQALNDTGAILHCLGRSGEAIEHFIKAKSLRGDSPEIIWNLVEAYLAVGRANEAMQVFDDMGRMGILNTDVLTRTAKLFLDQGNKGNAVETLLRLLQISPAQEILHPMLQVIRNKRPKIAFFCGAGGATSLNEIQKFTKQRFETHLLEGQTEELYELMKWSDICWFERCDDAIIEASRLPKVCKSVVRLNNFETSYDWLTQVQWENIDIIITIGSSSVKNILLEQIPNIQNRTQLISLPTGVNLDKFKFNDRHRGKNIACVGNLDIRKNPMFLLQCMQKLHYIDHEYRLFFAGTCQNTMLGQYISHMVDTLSLAGVVFFDGWKEDINSWLQDKHHIVSCSITESQNMGLLEGMACGLKPAIHNFPGASRIFPSEFLFNISEEFCSHILSDRYEPRRYRGFVEENYSLKNQLSKINDIFIQFEGQIDSQRTEAPYCGPRLYNG